MTLKSNRDALNPNDALRRLLSAAMYSSLGSHRMDELDRWVLPRSAELLLTSEG